MDNMLNFRRWTEQIHSLKLNKNNSLTRKIKHNYLLKQNKVNRGNN